MANFITIFRVILVFFVVMLLYRHSDFHYALAIILTIVAFALDGLDGWVARKFNETSKLGAVLDIMSDRIVENVFWVVFAVFDWLPISYAIIALTRSFVVDSLRSVALEQGYTAFGETSMQQDKFGDFICSSKFSRIAYAVSKMAAFLLLILARIPRLDCHLASIINLIALIFAFIAIEFCVLRGLPVVFESRKLFAKKAEKAQ